MSDIRELDNGQDDGQQTLQWPRTLWFTAFFMGFAIVGTILVYGRSVVIPIAVAVLIWLLINAIARSFTRISIFGYHPGWNMSRLASVATIVLFGWFVVELIADNVAEVRSSASRYEENFEALLASISGLSFADRLPSFESLIGRINFADIVTRLSTALGSLVGNAGLVALYVLFLMLEQESFDHKMKALFSDEGRREQVRSTLYEIEYRIERYLRIKTLVSILTALLSYAVLAAVGVDYAGFWALVVFLFNYIPNIGSLFAVILPTLLTLLQFGDVKIFLLVLVLLTSIQATIGNFVEPRLMGNSLNLSPLVIILSLTVWGSIWGIAGMFLSVPIMVMIVIVLSKFRSTRPLAILLSSDGDTGN